MFLVTNQHSISLIYIKSFGKHISKYISSKNIDKQTYLLTFKTIEKMIILAKLVIDLILLIISLF